MRLRILILLWISSICGACAHGPIKTDHTSRRVASEIESQATATVQAITSKTLVSWDVSSQPYKDIWKKKNCELATGPCFIEECDLQVSNCRPDHVLLFRAESAVYEQPAISDLARSMEKSVTLFQGKSSQDGLDTLKSEVNKLNWIQQDFFEDPRSGSYVLKNGPDGRHWYDTNGGPSLDGQVDSGITYTPVELLILFHMAGSHLFYLDPNMGQVPLDPFVSLSRSPVVPEWFLSSQEGRMIVLSVPRSEISSDCKNFGKEGSITDFTPCVGGRYAYEAELDAILFPQHEYVWKVYRASKSAALR